MDKKLTFIFCMLFISHGAWAGIRPSLQEYNSRLSRVRIATLKEIAGEKCWPLMNCIEFDAPENTNFNTCVKARGEALYHDNALTMQEVEIEYVRAIEDCAKTSGLVDLINGN